jgi:hypothetical protein
MNLMNSYNQNRNILTFFVLFIFLFSTLHIVGVENNDINDTNKRNDLSLDNQVIDEQFNEKNNRQKSPQQVITHEENTPTYDLEEGQMDNEVKDTVSIVSESEENYLNSNGVLEISVIDNENEELPATLNIFLVLDENKEVFYKQLIKEDEIKYLELSRGLYKVEAVKDMSLTSDLVYVSEDSKNKVELIFSKITFDAITDNDELLTISVQDTITGIQSSEITYDPNGSNSLYVPHGKYNVISNQEIFQTSVTTDTNIIQPITIKPQSEVSFGELRFYLTTANDMPLSSVTIRVTNNETGETAQGSTNTVGFQSFTLSPGLYNVTLHRINNDHTRIYHNLVEVLAQEATIIHESFSQLFYYAESSTYTEIWSSGGDLLVWGSTSSSTNYRLYYLPANISYKLCIVNCATEQLNFTLSEKEQRIYGDKINQAPVFQTVSTTGRINANGQTNITIIVSDVNYDFPMNFTYEVNRGSLQIREPEWLAYNRWGATVTYHAPDYDEIYRLDAYVSDGNLSIHRRIYLSDRTSTFDFNTTGHNDRPLNTYIEVRSATTGGLETWGSSGSNGLLTRTVPDGEYFIRFFQDNTFTTEVYLINATEGYYYRHHRFAELQVFTEGEYNRAFSASVRLYNATDTLSSHFSSVTSGSNGIAHRIVTPYHNYSVQAVSANGIWSHNHNLEVAVLYNVTIVFGVIVAYSFNENGDPLNVYTELRLNNTNENTLISWGNTGTSGFRIYRINPDHTYYMRIDMDPQQHHYNQIVDAANVLILGNFSNTPPIISAISASPARIGAGQNTTITVTATDADIIDNLDYVWVANKGHFIGNGSSIMYVAPEEIGLYWINVTVFDQFGGNDSTYIFVSNQQSTITFKSIDGSENNKSSTYTEIRQVNSYGLGSTISWGTTNSDGIRTHTGVYDGIYRMRGQENNLWDQTILVNGSDVTILLAWSEITYNTTSQHGNPLGITVRTYNNETGSQEHSGGTGSNGLLTLLLRPDIYNFRADSVNTYVWQENFIANSNTTTILDFKFATINLFGYYAFDNPNNFYTELRSETSSLLSWGNMNTNGFRAYHVAPGIYEIRIYTTPVYIETNIVITESNAYNITINTAAIVMFAGETAQTTRLYDEGMNQLATSNTGANGRFIVHTLPGTYTVMIGSSYWYNQTFLPNETYWFGNRTNASPTISSVSSSNGRINAEESTRIIVGVSDIDYDYSILSISAVSNVGTIGELPDNGWFTTNNNFRFEFEYHAPEIMEAMILNITISDGIDTTWRVFVVSNQENTLHVTSLKGDNLPESTTVRIYDHQTGSQIYSGTTSSSTGKITFSNILDGWYNIRFEERNHIWIYDIWFLNGYAENVTVLWGELNVYSVSTDGEPVNSYVEVRDPDTNSLITWGSTGSNGLINFLLAPGYYKVIVFQDTNIELFVTLEGGVVSYTGSGVPNLVSAPTDGVYPFGGIGYTISWNFTHSDSDYYSVSRNGDIIQDGSWDSSSLITVSLDGLTIGEYQFEVFVNTTSGVINRNSVTILISSANIDLTPLNDVTVNLNDDLTLNWQASSAFPDRYLIFVNDVLINNNTWLGDSVSFGVDTSISSILNITLVLTNIIGENTSDTVFVTIPVDFLSVSTNNDFYVFENETVYIEWEISSDYNYTYSIILNGETIETESSLFGNKIISFEEFLSIGVNNITIYVVNQYGRTVSSTVFVTVHEFIELLLSEHGNTTVTQNQELILEWNVTGDEPITYTIYMNGNSIETGTVTDNIVQIKLLFGTIGLHNITIVVIDSFGRTNSDTALITVDYVPMELIARPNHMIIDIESNTSVSASWTVTGSGGTYIIKIDGVEVNTGSWNSGTAILFNLNDLDKNVLQYKITIEIYDNHGNVITDQILVTFVEGNPIPSSQQASPIFLLAVLAGLMGLVTMTKKRRFNY